MSRVRVTGRGVLLKLAMLLAVTLGLVACGKRGALIYPDMLTPAAPSDVKAVQVGSAVKVSFVLPQKDQAGRGLSNLAGVDVFKRSAVSGQIAGCSACTVDYMLFKKIYLSPPDNRIIRNGDMIVLMDEDVRTDRDYYYYIIPFTNDAIAGKTSLPVMASVAEPPLPPVLKATGEPTEVRLTIVDPQFQKNDFWGYNLYRAVKGEALTIFPHNKELIKTGSFTDIGLKRGESYIYAVRKVVKRANGTLAESEFSNRVEAGRVEE